MPYLDKHTISQYFRTLCKRQLRLNLVPPDNQNYQSERMSQGMPPKQQPRPGLQHIVQAGRDWEIQKFADLEVAYSQNSLIGNSHIDTQGRTVYSRHSLRDALTLAVPYSFIIESEYDIRNVSTFENSLNVSQLRNIIQGYPLEYANLRPDIIQVLPPLTYNSTLSPDGQVQYLNTTDTRLQLKVIDVKHTSEPSASYFAEVAYYMMTLAGWLQDENIHNEFVVVSGAIWPGSHEASILRRNYQDAITRGLTPTALHLNNWLDEDLEDIPFEVFALRLKRFFQFELKEVLLQDWNVLPYHVGSVCTGCDYLGYPWISNGQPTDHPDHCIPTARRNGDLCQVAQLSPGACIALRDGGVSDINTLSAVNSLNPVLDTHQTLKAKRVVVPTRAQSLVQNTPIIPPGAGTSSVMPKWSDLSIYISVDFDITSAITVAFGLKAFWKENVPYGQQVANRQTQTWPIYRQGQPDTMAYTFIVDNRDVQTERRELIAFLTNVQSIINDVLDIDPQSTIQVYIWDDIQVKHLQRIIGRHLPAILSNQAISDLVWLFPPEDILPSHELQRHSPVTVLKEAIANLTALPIPHYYSLLQTARVYHNTNTNPGIFSVHPLFEDVLSDQIPSERAHEIWTRITTPGHHWTQQMLIYQETVRKRIRALEEVAFKLQTDLRPQLQEKAPTIGIAPPSVQGRMSADGELLFAFSRLDTRINEISILAIRAMPIHEREAKFHSAVLTQRLTGQREQQVLQMFGIRAQHGRRVYEIAPNSRSVKMKEGDFQFALSPNANASFLNQSFYWLTTSHPQIRNLGEPRWRMEDATGITIRAIDRDLGYLVVDADMRRGVDFLELFEQAGLADFTNNVSVDPVYKDYFTKKLLECLKSIGNPTIASVDPAVMQAIGQTGRRGARRTSQTPAADFIWDAHNLETEQSILAKFTPSNLNFSTVIDTVKTKLEQQGVYLNDTQWISWRKSLEMRLQVIWGPPGTGKSRTLRAIIAGIFEAAQIIGKPIRVLVCSFTYTAIDNVLGDAYSHLISHFSNGSFSGARLRSEFGSPPQNQVLMSIDLEVNRYNPSPNVTDILNRLVTSVGYTLVGATPEQVYNLLSITGNMQTELFDYILIDEASQMDVAHAVLPFCSIASGGNLILAGDPKQLPPIHQAEPPVGLEARVGSIYNYITTIQRVSHIMLDCNYRSNIDIVKFALEAGYQRNLSSYSPDLKLHLLAPLPTSQPTNWSTNLYWTPIWSEIMNPDISTVCYVYPDGKSSQWNDFEVDSIASLISVVYGNLGRQLENEKDINGQTIPLSQVPYTPDEFWKYAIGVVTPHRAQQSRIITKLQTIFGNTVSNHAIIRDAVDTVERFQGQERDIIVASFALGDPDMIQNEEEFLMSLNRFNVMASRARAKLIVLVSQEVIDYLGSNIDILRESKLLKVFAESFCHNSAAKQLGYIDNGNLKLVNGVMRYN